MPFHHTFITQLLRYYHGREAVSAKHFDAPTDNQILYLCDVGLGPVAFNTYGELLREANPDSYSVLQSADLTTRVIYKQMETATVELISILRNAGITPVLMKGISTAYEYYSPSHLRVMGDIDILVKHTETDNTMSAVVDLGYQISDEDWKTYHEKGHHHLPAARHPQTGVTVEVHTGLFEPHQPLASQPVFQPTNLQAQSVEFDYHGILTSRFTPEFQLVYTIAHWGVDGGWATNVTSINDVIHILRRHESTFDCTLLQNWIATNPWIGPNIFILINYLDRAGIIDTGPTLKELLELAGPNIHGRRSRLLFKLLHEYPMNASGKTPDSYKMWRVRSIWLDLTHPNCRDALIPFSRLRIAIKSIHHGKYNPLRWLLSLYRYISSSTRHNEP